MSYLAVKRVKGRYYAYRQESYREGGKVRTRTVEYLGAVDGGLAQKIKAGEIDTVSKKGDATAEQNTAEPRRDLKPPAAPTPPKVLQNSKPNAPATDRIRMQINDEIALVDRRTGTIIRYVDRVITTDNDAKTNRAFDQSLSLPDLENYGASTLAIQRTHARFGRRLAELQINPSHMSDVKVEYGHPDGFKANRDGSYSVVVSRRTKNKYHKIRKAEMWRNYRSALSHGFLDGIERGHPRLFDDLRLAFDHHYRESQRLALEAIKLNQDPMTKLVLSLQLKL